MTDMGSTTFAPKSSNLAKLGSVVLSLFMLVAIVALPTFLHLEMSRAESSRYQEQRLASSGPYKMDDGAGIVRFAEDVLSQCEPSKPDRFGKYREGWQERRSVPGSSGIAALLMEYAKAGGAFRVETKDGTATAELRFVGQPNIRDTDLGVRVAWLWTFAGRTFSDQSEFDFGYPTETSKALLRGEWTKYGLLEIRLSSDCLIPQASYQDGAATFLWATPPEMRFRWRVFRSWTFSLNEFVMTGREGRFHVSGIPDSWLPVLEWGE